MFAETLRGATRREVPGPPQRGGVRARASAACEPWPRICGALVVHMRATGVQRTRAKRGRASNVACPCPHAHMPARPGPCCHIYALQAACAHMRCTSHVVTAQSTTRANPLCTPLLPALLACIRSRVPPAGRAPASHNGPPRRRKAARAGRLDALGVHASGQPPQAAAHGGDCLREGGSCQGP